MCLPPPHAQVHFLKTIDGVNDALALPAPQSTNVAAVHVRKQRPE